MLPPRTKETIEMTIEALSIALLWSLYLTNKTIRSQK